MNYTHFSRFPLAGIIIKNRLNWAEMVSNEEIHEVLDKMILSASGWRGIFAVSGGEESAAGLISEAHGVIAAVAAFSFSEYLKKFCVKPLIFLCMDTRPTGRAIAEKMLPVLLAAGCEVRYAGFAAAPEIMAWARSEDENGAKTAGRGFIYISASHNPIGFNGIKFGLSDGGVLAADEARKLIADFRSFLERENCAAEIEAMTKAADSNLLEAVYAGETAAKADALKAYYNFCGDVIFEADASISAALKNGLSKHSIGIVCDFNGSARTVSIDKDFFSAFGLKFEYINGEPGNIVHRIVPEGESLEPCRLFLEKAHSRDASFTLGFVPDCDGDRGNLVIWDENQGKARALEAQEVFALACVAELSHLVWTGKLAYDENNKPLVKAAVVVNDPTSLRIDRIAEAFGVQVFRAEVGEANVVGLARKLRKEGYMVRILGEGSAGGNITHPSAVRDPIHTIFALVKLLALRSCNGKPGLFEIWLKSSGQTSAYRENFTLADIIASLPRFVTTFAYSKDAVLRINTKDHSLLKDRYNEVFLREWGKRKDELKTRYGICGWEASAYNGLTEKRGIKRFGEAGSGGLKISFFDETGREIAYIWMRGSATEPVFRIMADAQMSASHTALQFALIERDLLDWHRQMTIESDKE